MNTASNKLKHGQGLTVDGDTWRVLGVGATDEQGRTYVHLASTTRMQSQRNGARPIQCAMWL
jgi:hypothetical protein